MFKRYLLHDQLLVRFGALFGMVFIVLLGTWSVSYLLLPEGILRGRTAAQVLAGNDLAGGSVWLEWFRLFAINLGIMLLVMILPNTLRTEGDYPLGYSTITLVAAIFGVTLGTNSFALSLGGKLPPTMAIFGSSGLYEIAAYVLATTATISIAKYRLVGTWPKQTTEAIVCPQTASVIQARNLGIVFAIIMLLIACGWEASRFAQAIASILCAEGIY
jgi:hypothetical protein